MHAARVVATLFLLGCAGKAVEYAGDAGSHGDAVAAGDGESDGVASGDSATPLDGASCPYSQNCTFCSADGQWHCGSLVWQPCPPGAAPSTPCTTPNDPNCLGPCVNGSAAHLVCGPAPGGPGWIWTGTPEPYPCSP